MFISLLFLSCLFAFVLPLFSRRVEAIGVLALTGASALFLSALALGVPALFVAPSVSPDGLWYLDPFAAILVIIIGFVQWTATMVSVPYLRTEVSHGAIGKKRVREYYALVTFFVLSMFAAVLSNNLGLMWVALEATTLATTLLVSFYAKEASLEAAWKYLLLCSVGISLGLLGVFLTAYAAATSGLTGVAGISFANLLSVAATLPPEVMRIAFVFILVGFGTKVGLVPMHAWLPDAHGRTPSPVSGLLSGVLLNVALFALIRYKVLVDGALGGSRWSDGLFLAFGALSFIVPAAFILVQKNYKRLLAYSSIEHMGFVVFSFGLGVPGMIVGTMHLIGHALTKSMLFFAAGNTLLHFKTTKIANVKGVLQALPITGGFFLAGILAILAVPPSPLFVSEFRLVGAALSAEPWYLAGMLLAGAVIFAGFIRLLMPMLFQRSSEQPASRERLNLSHAAMALHLVAIIAFGIFFLTPAGESFITNIIKSL